MNSGDSSTVIGKSVRIVGELSGSEDLVMDGELHGSIRLEGSRLTIGSSARMRGNVAATNVIVLGRVEGDIRATGRVELRASSAVLGNIYAAALSMEENSMFRGQVDPSRAQEPVPETPAPRTAAVAAPASSRVSPLPAMLAAVAARTSQPSGDEKDTARNSNLFAETEA